MTDTHTHLFLEEFDDDGGGRNAVERAVAAGVDRLVMPNVDVSTLAPMMALAQEYPENVSIAIGLHPSEVTDNWKEDIAPIEEAFRNTPCVAVGEIGMDLYWDKTYAEAQAAAFDYQLHWGEERGLPVIIHCREALKETLEELRNYRGNLPKLIFHCFTGTVDDVREIRKVVDPWFGIGGVATFKNAGHLREALKEIGIDRILLETDSPYMAPVPMRGKRNESAYVPYIRNVVASTLGMTPEDVERQTDINAESLKLCSR